MKQKIDVLDKGFVELVCHMGSDLLVCNAARVSFDKETDWEIDQEAKERLELSNSEFKEEELRVLSDRDKKLINYLSREGHWTPFAHPHITLRVKAPISIRTQLFKHKQGFVENEISRRYVSYEPEFYYPKWRSKPSNGAKQGSDDFIEIDPEKSLGYENLMRGAFYLYEQLIKDEVAPEQARFVLPQSMYTQWFWTGSLAAYGRFFFQRIDNHAQWEARLYAEAISEIIKPLFPSSWSALVRCKE